MSTSQRAAPNGPGPPEVADGPGRPSRSSAALTAAAKPRGYPPSLVVRPAADCSRGSSPSLIFQPAPGHTYRHRTRRSLHTCSIISLDHAYARNYSLFPRQLRTPTIATAAPSPACTPTGTRRPPGLGDAYPAPGATLAVGMTMGYRADSRRAGRAMTVLIMGGWGFLGPAAHLQLGGASWQLGGCRMDPGFPALGSQQGDIPASGRAKM